jgi:transposase
MIRPSFIPPRAIRELATEERNRVQKVLKDANVKIGDVLSDVFGYPDS